MGAAIWARGTLTRRAQASLRCSLVPLQKLVRHMASLRLIVAALVLAPYTASFAQDMPAPEAVVASDPERSGMVTSETVTPEARLRALLRRHLMQCWRSPIDLPEPSRLAVTVRFSLNEDGTLSREPRVVAPRRSWFQPHVRTAVDRAVDAVRQCSPYPMATDPFLADRYEMWREVELSFAPPP